MDLSKAKSGLLLIAIAVGVVFILSPIMEKIADSLENENVVVYGTITKWQVTQSKSFTDDGQLVYEVFLDTSHNGLGDIIFRTDSSVVAFLEKKNNQHQDPTFTTMVEIDTLGINNHYQIKYLAVNGSKTPYRKIAN